VAFILLPVVYDDEALERTIWSCCTRYSSYLLNITALRYHFTEKILVEVRFPELNGPRIDSKVKYVFFIMTRCWFFFIKELPRRTPSEAGKTVMSSNVISLQNESFVHVGGQVQCHSKFYNLSS